MYLLKKKLFFPVILCLIFFLAYSVLSITRYNNYGAGYDLGIADQVVWEYSRFQAPITTVQAYAFTSLLTDHIEIIYMVISPFYWLWNDARMLLVLQSFFICISALPVFLLADKKKLNIYVSYALVISYLSFYGIQNALWADVHSVVFGASFLVWLLYFLEIKKDKLAILFLLLAILSKENIAGLTMVIGLVYLISSKRKMGLYIALGSLLYLLFVFGLYFPYLTHDGYRYRGGADLISNLNLYYLFDSNLKKEVFTYSFIGFGFLPILSPILLLPAIADLFSYFVLANHIKAGHELVQHYRVALGALMIWPTIITISKYKILNRGWLALYLLLCALFVQYTLHLPLSYLTKPWFWREPESVSHINSVIQTISPDASIVSQNNITAHLAHRNEIFTLFPNKKTFKEGSPCDITECSWFYWHGDPSYLVVDTSTEWDLRHFLTTRDEFISGLDNMAKLGYIKLYKIDGTARIYSVIKQP